MTRLRRLTRDALTAEQRELFDEIAGSEHPNQRPRFPRVGADDALEGPFNARLLSPAIGKALHDFASAVRYESSLPDRIREMTILITAAGWNSTYERYAHEDIGRAVGLTEAEMSAIAAGGVPDVTGDELAAATFAHALVERGDADDTEYAAAAAALGERAVFEITVLVGMYAQTALQLRVFRVDAPAH